MRQSTDIEKIFTTELSNRNIFLTETQLDKFRVYFQLLIEWNQRMNLTGITDEFGVYFKHFYDSISLSFCVNIDQIQTLVDIGPGAGFPGIPLKICFPHLKITMIESLNKRVTFLNEVINELKLSGINAVHGRAEECAHERKYRFQFDLATARAVSNLSTLIEISSAFLNESGSFIAMKGPDVADELSAAEYALQQLRVKKTRLQLFDLPQELGKRSLISFERFELTPFKYPRKQGLPFNKPL